jgi:hypothetical protein
MENEKAGWPKTVDEAVSLILSKMRDQDKVLVRDTPKEKLIQFHFGLGMTIRNYMGLWRGNSALLNDCKAANADDASMVIIKALWMHLQTYKKANSPNHSPDPTPPSVTPDAEQPTPILNADH